MLNIFWPSDVAPFRNHGDSKATMSKSTSISDFSPSLKLELGWAKCLSQFIVPDL